MKFKTLLLILLQINYGVAKAQDTISKDIRLIHGPDTLLFSNMLNKIIHTNHDSVVEYLQVFEAAMLKDTIIVAPGSYDLYSYKSTDKKNIIVQSWPNSKDRIKIPISNIDYIKRENQIKDFMQPLEIISIISGLIIAPLVSFGKPFKAERYCIIAGSSVAVFAVSLTIDRIWGQTIFRTKKYRNKAVWIIQ